MGFYPSILGVLAVGGLLAWNVHRGNRVSSESNNDESTNAVRYLL